MSPELVLARTTSLRLDQAMEIGVLGGAGVAGAAAVEALERRGHAVRVLSRRSGFDVTRAAASAEALGGLDALVDCLNPSKTTTGAARALLVDGLRGTLQAAADRGVGHVVSLSIVGIDHMPVGYYRVKLEQEAVVNEAPVPGTVLRATQFPQLFDLAWTATRRMGAIPAPRGPVAPIDPRDVGEVLADLVEAGPREAGQTAAVRGPQVLDLRDVAREWKAARGSRRPVLPLPAVGGMLRAIARGDLVDLAIPASRHGWAEWVATQAPAAPREQATSASPQ